VIKPYFRAVSYKLINVKRSSAFAICKRSLHSKAAAYAALWLALSGNQVQVLHWHRLFSLSRHVSQID
jgi:hypothetical protein